MRAELDPSQLTPEERLGELAAVLAGGLLRLRDRRALALQPLPLSEILPASSDPLEVHPQTSVTGLAV